MNQGISSFFVLVIKAALKILQYHESIILVLITLTFCDKENL